MTIIRLAQLKCNWCEAPGRRMKKHNKNVSSRFEQICRFEPWGDARYPLHTTCVPELQFDFPEKLRTKTFWNFDIMSGLTTRKRLGACFKTKINMKKRKIKRVPTCPSQPWSSFQSGRGPSLTFWWLNLHLV